MKKFPPKRALTRVYLLMPELKDMLAKASFGVPAEASIYLNTSNLHQNHNANNQARRESLFKNLNFAEMEKKENNGQNSNLLIPAGVVRRQSSNMQGNLESAQSEILQAERRVRASLEVADSVNSNFFILDLIDNELASNAKEDMEGMQRKGIFNHARRTITDVVAQKSAVVDFVQEKLKTNEHKKNLLSTVYFEEDHVEKVAEAVPSSILSLRQLLLKRERRNYCLVFFLLGIVLILASIGTTTYVFTLAATNITWTSTSVSLKSNFIQIYRSVWNIMNAVSRTLMASKKSPPAYKDFYFNQMMVRSSALICDNQLSDELQKHR